MLYYTGSAQNFGGKKTWILIMMLLLLAPVTLCVLRDHFSALLYTLRGWKSANNNPGMIHGCGGSLEGRRLLSPFCCRLTPLMTSLSRFLCTAFPTRSLMDSCWALLMPSLPFAQQKLPSAAHNSWGCVAVLCMTSQHVGHSVNQFNILSFFY